MSQPPNGLTVNTNMPTSPLLHDKSSNGHKLYTTPSRSCDDKSISIPDCNNNSNSNLNSSPSSKHRKSSTSKSTHSLPKGTSTIFGMYQNMLNALVGAGILGIPSVYSMCGLYGGIGLMIIFGLLSVYTMNLLITTAQIYHVTEYEELGYITFGTTGYILAASAMFLMDFGTCLNYLIILGDASFKVIQIWGYNSLLDRQLIIILVSMVIIFPPCLWRDISLYERFSGIKIIGVILVVCVVIYQYIMYRIIMVHDNDGYNHKFIPIESDTDLFNIEGIPSAVGIIAYCFVAHDTAFLYYNTLLNPTKLRWNKVVVFSIGSAMLLSFILSIPAYLTFGDNVQGNVLNNYNVREGTIIVTRIIYVIMMALAYPTAFFVVRHVIYAGYCRLMSLIKIQLYKRRRRKRMNVNNGTYTTLQEDVTNYSMHLFRTEYNVKNAPLIQHLIFTCLLFFITLILALFITNLGVAMSLIGNLSSVNLAFILPCITSIKASKYGFWSWIKEDTLRKKLNAWMEIYPPLLLALLGGFIAIYGVISTLQTYDQSDNV